jgi:hypothetical protein
VVGEAEVEASQKVKAMEKAMLRFALKAVHDLLYW